ncbi:MAG: anti-sigma factor [Chloroflexi bacterium]|nr:anti-sigma factor [Chloroflexota bacterium]
MSICQEIQDLVPTYVLDAITDSERAQIERHLPQCPDCAQLVAAYRPVADLLAFAAPPVEPSAELKSRVLSATMPKQIARASRPTFDLQSLIANLFRSPAFAAATMLLIVALAIWNFALQNQVNQQAGFSREVTREIEHQREFLNIVAYTDGQPRRMQATDAAPKAVGRLYAATELNAFALVVYDLPTLDANRAYQLWLIDPNGERTSGGTFTVDHEGTGSLVVHAPQPLKYYQGVGITIEPRGGSPKPTGARVLATSLRD